MNNGRHDNLRSETFTGKGILITGGAGYLASNLVSLLKDVNCRIIDLAGDVCDLSVLERNLERIDFIFHFAAQTSTYVANDAPIADQADNVMPMIYLLEACRRRGGCPTVCFSSTVTIAGISERLPVNETQPDHPLTMYDLHKQIAEQYLRWYAEQGYVRGVILRLANVYGPGPRSSSSDRGILNQMIRRALEGMPLTVYGAGDYLRDYVYVEDVVRAFVAAARHGEKLNGQYFVIGSGQGHTIVEAIQMIAERGAAKTGIRVPVLHVEPPDSLSLIEKRHFVADSTRFRDATGWNAHYTLAEGIDGTMEAFR